MLTYPQEVHAGPLRAVLRTPARLERLHGVGVELLRGLHVAVRDQAWNTVPGKLLSSEVFFGVDTFSSQFRSSHIRGDLDFEWEGRIDGDSDGNLRYELEGRARTDFVANRIGFVVLHSLNWVGQVCTLVHTDGTRSVARFPSAVSPEQPFFDLAGIDLHLASGENVQIGFEGDVFETEDQRNWSDASFKTYSRPLALPIPVHYRKGDRVRQAVTVRWAPSARATAQLSSLDTSTHPSDFSFGAANSIEFHGDAHYVWPSVGVGIASRAEVTLSPEEIADLHPAHIRVDVMVDAQGVTGLGDLVRAARLGRPLEVALHMAGARQSGIEELRLMLEESGAKVATVLVFEDDQLAMSRESLTLVKDGLGALASDSVFAVGTDDYFAELNRNRLLPFTMGADAVSFSLNPQVHDDESSAVLASVESLAAIVATASSLSGGAKVVISPITLKPRHNIYDANPIVDRLAPDANACDARQFQPFTAAWFVASLAHLAQAGASSLTFVELEGPRGLVPTARRSPAEHYPVCEAFRALRDARRGITRSITTGGSVDGVAFTTSAGVRAIIVNLTPDERTFSVRGLGIDRDISFAPYGLHVVDVAKPDSPLSPDD